MNPEDLWTSQLRGIRAETCYECSLYDGETRRAIQQLCGRWLCQRHLDVWLEKGCHTLYAINRMKEKPWTQVTC